MTKFLLTVMLFVAPGAFGQSTIPQGSTRAAATSLLTRQVPELQYNPAMPADSMPRWRERMSEAMASLMRHPQSAWRQEELVESKQMEGYRLERWRSWPMEDAPVHYLVLVPDSAALPAPAALCIPGFGQTKEMLADQGGMARLYVQEGIVAVAVDNPCFGELADNGYRDYLASARMLLEVGWSYLGLASWQDRVILDAMKRHPAIDAERLIVSGFSLGTEPLMVLGLLDPTIKAFVYNDFLCRTRERILVMDAVREDGSRPLPNSIEHLIPGFLLQFDFPDICAALSPRPLICTEGGMDRDFLIVADAYGKAGAPDAFSYYHYPKYADPSARALAPGDTVPTGIDRDTFFRLANVDPPSHYFKAELILPWVKDLLR